MTVKLLIVIPNVLSRFTIHEALEILSEKVQLPVGALADNSNQYERYNDLAYLSSLKFLNENLTGVLFVALTREPVDPLLAQIRRVFNPKMFIITPTPRLHHGLSVHHMCDSSPAHVLRRLPVYDIGICLSRNLTSVQD